MKFYLLDQVTELKIGEEASGCKCITYTDEVLHDHFPGFPIFPGTLITEGLAQLAGFLLEMSYNKDESAPVKRALLVQVDKMKFHSTSGPGDKLIYQAQIESLIDDTALVNVSVTCDGEKRAKGKLMFMLKEFDSSKVTEQRIDLYSVWTRKLNLCLKFR